MTLGITMIVKNEKDVLSRALGGVKSFADEIVVVDTGSTDGTPDIARGFTDKVYSYEWNDDFSAARNFALSKSTADYWMWLDADDVVPERTAAEISRFKMRPSGVDVVMLPYVMGYDKNGKPTFFFYRERIIKKGSGVWEGRVHEAVAPRGTIRYLNCPIVHDKPAGKSSGTRNLDIYRKMAAHGERFSPRDKYYYARELFFAGLYENAERELIEFLSDGKGSFANNADACIILSRCNKKRGDIVRAKDAAIAALEYGVPSGEICCEIASCFFEQGEYGSAAYWYELALKAGADKKSGAFVNGECCGFIPLVWLSVCYDRLGETKKAFRYHKKAMRIRPDDPSIAANSAYFSSLGLS